MPAKTARKANETQNRHGPVQRSRRVTRTVGLADSGSAIISTVGDFGEAGSRRNAACPIARPPNIVTSAVEGKQGAQVSAGPNVREITSVPKPKKSAGNGWTDSPGDDTLPDTKLTGSRNFGTCFFS